MSQEQAENFLKSTTVEDDKPKNFRHRKKEFYNSIRQQMEFYFGDANLSKDRYLMKSIETDPFVPLDIFLKFNKIKKLTNSVEDIAKALKNSTLLELSEDGKKVRRATEICKERNADEKTIYVESVPRRADHDWIIKVFSRYGPVEYVSLPRYKRSRKLKEFGFVEFKNESSVEKVLNAFKEFGGLLQPESYDPSKLQSITSFTKEQNEQDQNSDSSDTENTDDEEKIEKETEAKENNLKRKKENESSDEEEDDLITTKKLKTESEEENFKTASDQPTSENPSDNEDENNDKNMEKEKRKKHRKKKKKNHLKGIDESNFRELKILTKKDWKRLRNKYLNMQREKVKEFKKLRNRLPSRESNKTANNQKSNLNFYCANKDLETKNENLINSGNQIKSERNLAEEKKPLFNFESGIIVRIKFLEPCVDVKSFKADMKQYNYVKYVDVKEGAFESYIRCDNPSNAEKLVEQISCAEYQCEILQGDEEKQYWEKIMKDREMKLNEKVKVKQKRGREKIAKSLCNHIRFDDE